MSFSNDSCVEAEAGRTGMIVEILQLDSKVLGGCNVAEEGANRAELFLRRREGGNNDGLRFW